MQSAKIIDIKRSFVPVDANAFPETLHLDNKEDFPEGRVPIVPYIGYNFLPTSYGYKSFFGENSALGFDTLLPNKADHIFVIQSLAYKNVVIALCDTGIWAKSGTTVGAWTQLQALVIPDVGASYDWSWAVISNKLYIYRTNEANFWEIVTDIGQPLGVVLNVKTPSFITPTAQLGMFKLGARLGFWDAQNAVCWSSADDVTDFTPSVLTGANVTTFTSVKGKISAIRPHGKNAIVYSSKGAVHLEVQPSDTFLVKAVAILDGVGIPYAQQSVEGVPNDTHFVYTTGGIYKIEKGVPEVIVPEIYDYFKPTTTKPIYLKLLQGRYLAFKIMDENAVDGNPLFSVQEFGTAELVFPGYQSTADTLTAAPEDVNMCEMMALISSGGATDTQQQATADLPDKKPGTDAKPIWTCYLSDHGIKDISNLTFGQNPCSAPIDMSPIGVDGNKLSAFTTDVTNKTPKTGAQAYQDGKWTMERFVAAQETIWELEEKTLDALINAILSKTHSVTTTDFLQNCVASNVSSDCELGTYATKFSPHKFGYNTCSFWLTRFVIETKDLATRTVSTNTCSSEYNGSVAVDRYELWLNGSRVNQTNYGSAEAAAQGSPVQSPSFEVNPLGNQGLTVFAGNEQEARTNGWGYVKNGVTNQTTDYEVKAHYQVLTPALAFHAAGWRMDPGNPIPVALPVLNAGYQFATNTASHNNVAKNQQVGILGVETAWCEITGWEYTKNDGTTATAPASACLVLDNKAPKSVANATERTAPTDGIDTAGMLDPNGALCNLPFEPSLIPNVSWPNQTLTYPGLSFLLQDGAIAPKYPTFFGALVYDLHLKKWGKYKAQFKGLLDYSPLNNESQPTVTSSNFGMLAGAWKEDGFIYIFDDKPADSLLTWGKFGYYRLGMSDLQEVTFHFKEPATGSIAVDMSLDGRTIVTSAKQEEIYSNARTVTLYPVNSGKWYNVSVTGQFDVTDLIIKGFQKGRR